MSAPKTLLELSGADMRPAPLAGAALVIIDAQNEYLDGKLALPGVKPAVDALTRLLAKARDAGAPVVHVQHKGRPGGLFDVEGRGGAIIEAVKPVGGEAIVQKGLPNAFAQTDLDATLKKLGRTQLTVHLQEPMTAIPTALSGWRLTLNGDGHDLEYSFDANSGSPEIAGLLKRLTELGIAYKDLRTRQSSLEEIFVGLIRQRK